jgi:hypothetical protein
VYPSEPDATARFCVGVTAGAALVGDPVDVQVEGILTESSWAWSGSEPVWLTSGGGLSQTRPTTGALFQVGVPAGTTALRIEPQMIAILP